MDKKLEEFNWVVGDSARSGLRNTSHSGRMTGVSIGCQMGADHPKSGHVAVWRKRKGTNLPMNLPARCDDSKF